MSTKLPPLVKKALKMCWLTLTYCDIYWAHLTYGKGVGYASGQGRSAEAALDALEAKLREEAK